MTRTTLVLAPSSPNFRTTPTGGHLTSDRFNVHQAHKHGGSSVESGFEPEALRLRNRHLTTRSPQPQIILLELVIFPFTPHGRRIEVFDKEI
ncbi:hypothetical protein AVEN_247118-1 [Araneus ventricosus]|uniref:Uncharacterized protein n=1 Tax=Araneus ventricosus TaxID=182803 RepID=A0A4Y2FS59_ARAVE|nr:hypothetical protein AVEN_247118-1 [Araneus ventricosus]